VGARLRTVPAPRTPPAADLDELTARGLVDLVEVGRGSHAVVYRAHQPAFARDVAVKVLDVPAADAAALTAWRRECAALGAVSAHPSIVALLDAGTTASGRPYLVLDHAPGGSLAARVAARGPLPWQAVAHIGVGLAGALEAAHRAGVLHLDVKPDNLLVSAFGQVQLADFGVARVQRDTDDGGPARGSLAHAAPEVLAGRTPTPAADVYGLASTLRALLSGTAAAPDALDAPAPLAAALAAGLARDPRRRPASAAAFGRLLQQAQADLGAPVTPLVVTVASAGPDTNAATTAAAGSTTAPTGASAAPAGPPPAPAADVEATRTFGPGPPLLQPAPAPRPPAAVVVAACGGVGALLLAVAHLVAV